MAGKQQFARILGAVAVLAALSFASSAAQAHAGHVHHAPPPVAVTSQAAHADTAAAGEVCEPAMVQAPHVQVELKTANTGNGSPGANSCASGCCNSVPCTTCIGLLASPVVSAAVAAEPGSPLELADAPMGHGLGPQGIRRPPRSFV